MKRFRWRISSLLWLVAVVATFLGGIRYWQVRAETRAEAIERLLISSPAQGGVDFVDSKVATRSVKTQAGQ